MSPAPVSLALALLLAALPAVAADAPLCAETAKVLDRAEARLDKWGESARRDRLELARIGLGAIRLRAQAGVAGWPEPVTDALDALVALQKTEGMSPDEARAALAGPAATLATELPGVCPATEFPDPSGFTE